MNGMLLELNMELPIICRFVKFLNTFCANIKIINKVSAAGHKLVWANENDIKRLISAFHEHGAVEGAVVSLQPHVWLNEWEN